MAVLMAAVGIYGVMAYSVEARTREIGVRMALGATTAAVLGRALELTAAGVTPGVAGALASTRVLASLLFEVNAVDAATFAAASLLVAPVAAGSRRCELTAWTP